MSPQSGCFLTSPSSTLNYLYQYTVQLSWELRAHIEFTKWKEIEEILYPSLFVMYILKQLHHHLIYLQIIVQLLIKSLSINQLLLSGCVQHVYIIFIIFITRVIVLPVFSKSEVQNKSYSEPTMQVANPFLKFPLSKEYLSSHLYYHHLLVLSSEDFTFPPCT